MVDIKKLSVQSSEGSHRRVYCPLLVNLTNTNNMSVHMKEKNSQVNLFK